MSRIGGAFPLPNALPQEGGGIITLASGGVFYIPSGEYLLQTGSATCMEWWDPIGNVWRQGIGVSCAPTFIMTDGYNFRLRNLTGTITAQAVTGAGSGGTNGIGNAATGAAVGIAASNTAGGANATAYPIVGGTVPAPTVTQAGSGFTEPPLVVIDPPPSGGIQATAVAALTAGGGIASVTIVTAGAGYAAVPNFYLIPQTAVYQGGTSGGNAAGAIPAPGLVHPNNAAPGNQNTSPSGALLTGNALTGSGTFTGFRVINPGGGYTSASPTVTVTGIGAATATVTIGTTTPANDTTFLQPRAGG